MRKSFYRGGAAGAICAALLAVFSLFDPTLAGSEWLLEDLFTRRIAHRHPPDPRVVVVAVSEQAVANLASIGYGRPPFSRELYADVIDELQRAGAKVIGVDIAFSEEDLAHPAGDRRLADSLARAPVVLGADSALSTDPAAGPQPASADDPRYWKIDGAAPPKGDLHRPRLPLAMFQGATIGSIRVVTSRNSAAIRDYPIAERVGPVRYVPSLAAEMYRRFRSLPPNGNWSDGRFRMGALEVPVDERGAFSIFWHGGRERALTYRAVGIDKVLLAALAHDDPAVIAPAKLAEFERQFRDAIVLIGFTAVNLNDLRNTPLSATTAGLEIHANALDDLLHRTVNRPLSPAVTWPLLVVIAAAFGLLVDRTRSQITAALIALGAVALTLVAGYLLLANGLRTPLVAALATFAATYALITVVNFMAEQRQTQVLRTTFGRYVSPQILEHILAHPEKVQLGGERRDLTILFSDIRGFTSISEASEPEQVVEMLNEYLTRMVEILLEHGGTLDKFIGDAVMGFWNAPAAATDHARSAVRCAIVMIEETARLRARWETEGKASIRIGIGINTGDAVAGNIGAEQVFGYTVIGDAVNLASRLESKNKDYGTEIIISEFTLARIGDGFETVYLDDVKVKGKEKAVKIYEVKGLRNA